MGVINVSAEDVNYIKQLADRGDKVAEVITKLYESLLDTTTSNIGGDLTGTFPTVTVAAAKRPLLGMVKGARAVATSNITLSGAQTIDGVSCVAGDRVLAQNQTTAANRGIWVVASGSWTRPADWATGAVVAELEILVSEGSTYGHTVWSVQTTGTITVGTTGLTITQTQVTGATAGGDLTGTYPNPTITAGALSADASGRAKFAANFFDVATVDAKIATGAIGEDRLTSNELTGRVVANVADANVIGGIPVVHRVLVASGANGSVDTVLTHKSRVLSAWFVLKGAGTAGTTLRVTNGTSTNYITEAYDASALSDKDSRHFATIDDAQHEIAAAGTLRVTKASTGADFPGAEVYVLVVRIA